MIIWRFTESISYFTPSREMPLFMHMVVSLHYLILHEEIREGKACSKIATILLLGEKSFHQQLMIILVINSSE